MTKTGNDANCMVVLERSEARSHLYLGCAGVDSVSRSGVHTLATPFSMQTHYNGYNYIDSNFATTVKTQIEYVAWGPSYNG